MGIGTGVCAAGAGVTVGVGAGVGSGRVSSAFRGHAVNRGKSADNTRMRLICWRIFTYLTPDFVFFVLFVFFVVNGFF